MMRCPRTSQRACGPVVVVSDFCHWRRVQRERSHCGSSGGFKEGLLAQVWVGVGDGEAGLWGTRAGSNHGKLEREIVGGVVAA